MENALKYQVRSREIIDLIQALRNGSLILSPYFQRNLVWRDTHKRDFIETILHGYPFPQVFLARGPIDVETMRASTCVVDGQQRLTTIREYVAGELEFSDDKKFENLSRPKKEEFLKYEVPVIDFDLDAGDDRLKDIFQRLNRTFYSLTTIEKIASEFSASHFLLTSRLLTGDFSENDHAALQETVDPSLFENFEIDESEGNETKAQSENPFLVDPGISSEMIEWLKERAGGKYGKLIGGELIFSNYEAQRKVPIMFVLNIISTIISGYYNRNLMIKKHLEMYNQDFENADYIINKLNHAAEIIEEMNFSANSIWWNKANFFTLSIELVSNSDSLKPVVEIRNSLNEFADNLPDDYQLAAREGVNNKGPRQIRAKHVKRLLTQ